MSVRLPGTRRLNYTYIYICIHPVGHPHGARPCVSSRVVYASWSAHRLPVGWATRERQVLRPPLATSCQHGRYVYEPYILFSSDDAIYSLRAHTATFHPFALFTISISEGSFLGQHCWFNIKILKIMQQKIFHDLEKFCCSWILINVKRCSKGLLIN